LNSSVQATGSNGSTPGKSSLIPQEELATFYSASLVAQLVKNLPVKWETWVRSLNWEDPLEKG